MESDTAWDAAVEAAAQPLPKPGARRLRGHAAGFASWCHERNRLPTRPKAEDIDGFIASIASRDRQMPAKVRCSLRAVLRRIDEDTADRAVGLGRQDHFLAQATPNTAQLVRQVVDRKPERAAARRSALGRLFAWARHVGCDPTRLAPGDVVQFREWLAERRAGIHDTLPVALEFIALSRSEKGSVLLNRPPREPARLKLELTSPLAPRFDLEAVTPNRMGQSPVAFRLQPTITTNPLGDPMTPNQHHPRRIASTRVFEVDGTADGPAHSWRR